MGGGGVYILAGAIKSKPIDIAKVRGSSLPLPYSGLLAQRGIRIWPFNFP